MSFSFISIAAPGIPTNLKLVKKTASSLTISWESPSSIVSPIHEYEVCFDNTVNRHPSCRERVSKPEETTIDKLMANTTYEVKVQAFVQRHRDNEDLGGKSVMKYFKTGNI